MPLADVPTPVERMLHLEVETPHADDVRLFVKRDDLSNAIYGGNKVRKFEFVMARAAADRAREVATAGGWGSHHVLATAVFAKQIGIAARAYVFPQPMNDHVREQLLAMTGCGAELVPCCRPSDAFARLARARTPGLVRIPPGGSSPAGTLGYVEAGLEIAEQVERGELPVPDAVVVALGSGGTAAGLAVGLALAGLPTEVIAVPITSPLVANAARIRLLARAALKLLDPSAARDVHPRVRIARGYMGRGYGYPTPEALSAAERARATEGLRLEISYTAKAMAAFLDVASREAARGRTFVFLDTVSSRPLASLIGTATPDDLPPSLRRAFRRPTKE